MSQELRNKLYRDVPRTCDFCGNSYLAWRYNKNPKQYCTVSCSIRARRNTDNTCHSSCLACGAPTSFWQSQPKKFCSTTCANTQRGNKSKWYTVGPYRCQGLYEVAFALWALEHDLKLNAHAGMLRWLDEDGKTRRYFPDFWVENWDCYVEIKSEWTNKQHPLKMENVRLHNPDVEVCLLTENELSCLGVDVSRNTMYRHRTSLKNNPECYSFNT